MAKQQQLDDSKEIVIDKPGAVGLVRRASFPGPADPRICEVSGSFTWSPLFAIDSIKILTVKTDNGQGTDNGNPYASAADEAEAVRLSGVDVPSGNITRETDGSGTWQHDMGVVANIDRDDPQADNHTWNRISVLYELSEASASSPPLPQAADRVQGKQFKAKGRDSCEQVHEAQTRSERAALAERISFPMLPALGVCDGWIRYSFFNLMGGNVPFPTTNGFQLATPHCCKTPLSAREIAIATGAVNWKPRRGEVLTITHPLGIVDTSSTDGARRMPWPGLPKFCFYVHQHRNLLTEDLIRVPVLADCRENAHRISLYGDRPFFVQVHNFLQDRTKSDGTLEFWVKVLS